MHISNMVVASVDTTAGGSEILSSDEADLLLRGGLEAVAVNPSLDIYLVNNQGLQATTPGTAANSPLICPANQVTILSHRSGPIRAITASGTATVKRAGIRVP